MDIVDADFVLALQLQEQFNRESENGSSTASSIEINTDDDYVLALQLQEELNKEAKVTSPLPVLSHKNGKTSIIDGFWELNDPNPDIHGLFLEFNSSYFWNKLQGVEVRWSSRMTLCAGVCCYEGFGGLCSIRLSLPLLKLRPRKDLVETLLHEMIHAYLFVTCNNRDHDSHGPEFLKHMSRINKLTGANITVYHNFHDEVNEYRQHWWRCTGPCRHRPPYYGIVRRAMNRAPSANDFWWEEHRMTCGGTYEKIKEPEKSNTKRKEKEAQTCAAKKAKTENVSSDKNRLFSDPSYKTNGATATHNLPKGIFTCKSPDGVMKSAQITPFTGKGHVLGSYSHKNSCVKKSHTLLSYFESKKDTDTSMRHLSSNDESKVGKGKGSCPSPAKKLSGSTIAMSLASLDKLLSPDERGLKSASSSGTSERTDKVWQKLQKSSHLKEVGRRKFLPAGKLSTASPLNHVRQCLPMTVGLQNWISPNTLGLSTSVQKAQFANTGLSLKNPIILDDESDALTNAICPVCNQKYEDSQINSHLDKCLKVHRSG